MKLKIKRLTFLFEPQVFLSYVGVRGHHMMLTVKVLTLALLWSEEVVNSAAFCKIKRLPEPALVPHEARGGVGVLFVGGGFIEVRSGLVVVLVAKVTPVTRPDNI